MRDRFYLGLEKKKPANVDLLVYGDITSKKTSISYTLAQIVFLDA